MALTGTLRNMTAVDSLFADGQGDGAITPGDVRDLIKSVYPHYGAVYQTGTPAETVISTPSVYVESNVSTSIGTTVSALNFDTPANGRVRYTGLQPILAFAHANIAMSAPHNNISTEWYIYKYDDSAGSSAPIAESHLEHKIGSGSDISAVSLTGIVQLDQNDYVNVWCQNTTNTTNIQVEDFHLFCLGFTI